MPYVNVGTEKKSDVLLSYADYGEGKPIVLIHGWPLSHRMWEQQIGFLVEAGYRVIAYDRRGFGESYKTWDGYDYDTLAADLDTLLSSLDLNDVTLVGFSMGGGEVARYIGTYGGSRVAKAVLMSAVTTYMIATEDNPDGFPEEVLQAMADAMKKDRISFIDEFNQNFVNWDTTGKNHLTQANLDYTFQIAAFANPRATLACAEAFSTTDFREDLKNFDVPTLVIHGEDDRIVPFEHSGKRAHEMIKGSELAIIEGGPHGITLTHAEKVNQKLLEFIQK